MNIRDTDRVLDLGIGTGVSLELLPADRGRIIGVDLSGGMLRKARKKIRERGLTHATVFQADAHAPAVRRRHVRPRLHQPRDQRRQRPLPARSAKPSASPSRARRIVIVNHFQSTNRFIALVEKWLCPLCTKLGWRSDLALQDLVRRTGVEIDYRYKLESIDLWETVVMTNNKSALAMSQPATLAA